MTQSGHFLTTSFFLSGRSVRPDNRSGMPPWQDRIFILLARNTDDASSYFQLPTDHVVEIGTHVGMACSVYVAERNQKSAVPQLISLLLA
jgi:K+ transporter